MFRDSRMEYIVQRFRKKGAVLVMCSVLGVGLAACAPVPASPATPTAHAPLSKEATVVERTVTTAPVESRRKASPTPALTQAPTPTGDSLDHAVLLDDVLYSRVSLVEAQAILEQIGASSDTRFVAGLIDSLRYRRRLSEDIGRALDELTGQDLPADWFEWVEWAGKHPEIESFPGYAGWKAELYSNIDPTFLRFVYPGVKVAPGSRVEEIVWGGVPVDGIPALDNPKMVDPSEADYLVPHERVFGVSINGDTRAYPARFLDWHEMFNDVVGGEPVSLAY
jgi:hypothetical protein